MIELFNSELNNLREGKASSFLHVCNKNYNNNHLF